eukprot:6569567-Pyramimonas_sp.AAC.1
MEERREHVVWTYNSTVSIQYFQGPCGCCLGKTLRRPTVLEHVSLESAIHHDMHCNSSVGHQLL